MFSTTTSVATQCHLRPIISVVATSATMRSTSAINYCSLLYTSVECAQWSTMSVINVAVFHVVAVLSLLSVGCEL